MRVVAPRTIEEALETKSRLGADARVLAGGQSLAVLLQKGLVMPETLIYLGEIKELASLSISQDDVRLGAMVTSGQVELSEEVSSVVPLLSYVCSVVASPHVRNMGTVVGNLCHAEVGSDPPQALLALDAEVHALSARGHRWIPIADFILDYFETALEDDEIATEVRFKPFYGKSTYIKHRVRHMDLAVTGVAVALNVNEDGVTSPRFAVGGTGPRPLRANAAEAQMDGLTREEAMRSAGDIGAAVAEEVNPSLSDAFGHSEYRKRLLAVSVRRGVQELLSPG